MPNLGRFVLFLLFCSSAAHPHLVVGRGQRCEPKAMFSQALNLPAHFPPGFADGGSPSRVQAGGLCTNGKPILRDESTGQLVCGCHLSSSLSALHPHHLPPHHATLPSAPHPHHPLPTSSPHPHGLPVQVPLPAFTAARGVIGSDPLAGTGVGVNKEHLSTRAIPLGGPYTAAAYAAYHPYLYHGYDLGVRKTAVRETTQPLKAWLHEHRKNPYPTKAEKIMLAIITQMTLTQVSTWFANARRRLKKEGGGGHWESVSDGGETTGSHPEDPSSHKDGSSLGDHYEDLSDDSAAEEDVGEEEAVSPSLPRYHPPRHSAFTSSSSSSPPDPHHPHHPHGSPEDQPPRPGILRPSVLHPTPLLLYPTPSTTTSTIQPHLHPVHPGHSLLSVSANTSSAFTTAQNITAGDITGNIIPRSVTGNVTVVSAPAVPTVQQTGVNKNDGGPAANSSSGTAGGSKGKPRIWSISSIMGFQEEEEEAGSDSVASSSSTGSSWERSSGGAPRISGSPEERSVGASRISSPPSDGGSFSDYSASSGVEHSSPHHARETRFDCENAAATDHKERRRDEGGNFRDFGEKVRDIGGENVRDFGGENARDVCGEIRRDVGEVHCINASEQSAKDVANEQQRNRSPKKDSSEKKTTLGKDMEGNRHNRNFGEKKRQRETRSEQTRTDDGKVSQGDGT